MSDHELREEIVWTACYDSAGAPTMQRCSVKVTQEQYDLGEHYDMAEDILSEGDYEGPFVHFDRTEVGDIVQAGLEISAENNKAEEAKGLA